MRLLLKEVIKRTSGGIEGRTVQWTAIPTLFEFRSEVQSFLTSLPILEGLDSFRLP